MGYKVVLENDGSIVVPEALNKEPLRDMNGNEVGYDHLNHTYYNGEIIPNEKISPVVIEKLKSTDENDKAAQRLQKVLVEVDENGESLDLKRRLGVPFEGYDDMEEDDIVAALHFLPGEAVQAVKDYEATRETPRYKVTSFNVGRRDNNFERVAGDPVRSSVRQDAAEGKASAALVTREVGEDTVQVGEGLQASDALTHEEAVQAAEDNPKSSGGDESTGPKRAPSRRRKAEAPVTTGEVAEEGKD